MTTTGKQPLGFSARHRRDKDRQRILARARLGEISNVQAEEEALRQDCGPLAHNPDKQRYNINKIGPWSLYMAIAWVRWRSDERVLDFYPPYLATCKKWRGMPGPRFPQPRLKWELVTRESECSLSHLNGNSFRSSTNSAPGLSYQEAEDLLFFALSSEDIEAFAVENLSGRILQIPAIEWHFLKLKDGQEAKLARSTEPAVTVYSEIKLDGAAIMRMWGRGAMDRPETPSERSQRQFESLEELLDDYVQKGIRISRKKFEAEAKARKLSSTKARDVFKTSRPTDWKPGRRKNS